MADTASHLTTDMMSYCTFWLDGQLFGIEVLEVQEVLRTQATTPVPLAPAAITGLINLRGQIITAIDLRTRLELAPRADDDAAVNIVVRTGDGPVSLLVDTIGGVVEVDRADYERPPETISGAGRELIAGVYKVDGPLLHVLEVGRVIGDLVTTRKGDA
jgi:purine-binding chemotaxis protein CheW